MTAPDDVASPHPQRPLRVTVERSGGIAGITRRWSAAVDPSDENRWAELISACGWPPADTTVGGAGAPDRPAEERGADRFQWTVTVVTSSAPLQVELSDSAAAGPWRTLIDAVRSASDDGSRRPEAGPSAPEE